MKKVILVTVILICSTISFAQTKKEASKSKASPDSLVVAKPDTIVGSYFSLEQGKVIQYKALITKEEIQNITNCTGYCFRDTEGKIIAYTPCKDYSFKSLVVVAGREKDLIDFLRTNQVSLK